MEFENVIKNRETVRKFDGKKPTNEQLLKILEAGRIAPTAKNAQPQKIFVLEGKEALDKMDKLHAGRYGANMVLLVCADRSLSFEKNGKSTYEIDASIVATHIILEAFNIGVDTAWLGIFNAEDVKREFGLDKNIEPVCFIDLGFRTKDYAGSLMHNQKNSLDNLYKRI